MNYLPKDYVPVADRIEKYHAEHDSNMSIETTFTLQGDVAIFKAVVITKKGTFTGSSFGKLGREKAFEKLETISVGRALAFAGYETRSGIASREEMEVFHENQNDIEKQYDKPLIGKKNIDALIEKFKKGELVGDVEYALATAREHYNLLTDQEATIRKLFSEKII